MLNNDALQQLARLKSSMVEAKDIAQGLVRSTTRRFGFLILDDGREAFVDPEQMQRVLPDDRVEAEILTNDKGQYEAKLLKLIQPGLDEFVGRYVNKGNADFVEPDVPQFNRWLFIPPQERKGYKVGDLIQCRIARHPFNNDNKAQVTIINRIGTMDDPGIEARYALAKFRIPNQWIASVEQQAKSIHWTPLTFDNNELDLTHLSFVTIDSENTRDMDDAVFVQTTPSGWELIVAIADPSKHIHLNSPLELAARERASTLYLWGQIVSMLPPELSQDTYSLVPEQKRAALICRMKINDDGKIESFEFAEAQIRSQAKLNYDDVNEFITHQTSNSSDTITATQQMLLILHELTQARIAYRQANALIMEDRADYSFILNEHKKIERIEKRERNAAHRMIEEAMLATNICAGEFFLQHLGLGIFSNHAGFRTERIQDALSLIKQDRPDLEVGDLTQLAHFQHLFSELRLNPTKHLKSAYLHSLLQRMMQASNLSFEPIPHFGLGFRAYAMITSPIRRYQDLFNHLAIKSVLRNQKEETNIEKTIVDKKLFTEQLQQQINLGRQTSRYVENWLGCQYAAQHLGSAHAGIISVVNSFGIGVRLDDWGLEGFVTLSSKEKEVKAQFDAGRYELTVEGNSYRLDQKVLVMIETVDLDNRKINLKLIDESTAERLSAWL
jgi:exoribonuclease II